MTTSPRISRMSVNGHDFTDKIADLRTLLNELVKLAPAVAGDAFDDFRRQGSELWESGEVAEITSEKSVLETIKQHPLQIISVAIASGVLAWWLLTRDERHDGKNRK